MEELAVLAQQLDGTTYASVERTVAQPVVRSNDDVADAGGAKSA